MKTTIYPCWILLGKIKEASAFYLELFKEASILEDTEMVKTIQVLGQQIMLLNEGPPTRPNPSISFMLNCTQVQETNTYWEKLSRGGKVLMPLDAYPWSPLYGWVEDRFGISWQMNTHAEQNHTQSISPVYLFSGDQAGKAAEAIQLYTRLFKDSKVQFIARYTEKEGNPNFIKQAELNLDNYHIRLTDSPMEPAFPFNEGVSMVIPCRDQQEIDRFWEGFLQAGAQALACGWLKDPFGACWQIVPHNIHNIMQDPRHGPTAFQAMLKMKKIIIADLLPD